MTVCCCLVVAAPIDWNWFAHFMYVGGGTRRVGVKFEVASPQQVWRAGGDTFTPSTAGQVPNLSLDPASSQDVFLGVPIRLSKQPSARSVRGGWGRHPARWREV